MAVPDVVADALRARGWAIASGVLDEALVADLLLEANAHRDAGRLRPASTGRGTGRHDTDLRGDSTLWLDEPVCGDAAGRALAMLDALRIALNRNLLLGLDEVEAHFAHYPPGAGYVRHRDRFRDDDARVLSLVLYLDRAWPADAGGHLRLHLPEGTHDIAPVGGTTVLFLSDEIEHEVLPATRDRFSVAAWLRRRAAA